MEVDLGRVLAYRPDLKKICDDSLPAGLLLSQYVWISSREEGFFHRDNTELEEATALNEKAIQRARKLLLQKDFLEKESRGWPRKTFYKVNMEAISAALTEMRGGRSSAVSPVKNEELETENTVSCTDNMSGQNPTNCRLCTDNMSGQDPTNCRLCTDNMSSLTGHIVVPYIERVLESSRETPSAAASAAPINFESMRTRIAAAKTWDALNAIYGKETIKKMRGEFEDKNDHPPAFQQMKAWVIADIENRAAGEIDNAVPTEKKKSQTLPPMPAGFPAWLAENYPKQDPNMRWHNEPIRDEFFEDQKV